ncbi:Membrane magnesium transporter 1 [Actinomortierella ambigua]|nr:Membrane magnesium transporter 1 [Actinomortierella ambigua]
MQWCLVLSKVDAHFEAVKSTAKEHIEQQEEKLAAITHQHEALSTQFAMERDLSTLEATFGPVRDKLSRVHKELQTMKATLEQSVSTAAAAAAPAVDRQSLSPTIVAVDHKRLTDLEKVTLECQHIAQGALSQSIEGSNVIKYVCRQLPRLVISVTGLNEASETPLLTSSSPLVLISTSHFTGNLSMAVQQAPSYLGRLVCLLGFLILFHSGYSTFEHLSYLKAVDGHESGLPTDIAVELLVSVALCGLGIVLVADDFKEILMETEMAKQSIESLDARPSFYAFNHRGRAVFRNVLKN